MSDKRISSSEQPATPGVSSLPLGDESGSRRIRLACCWIKLTGTSVVITMWQPQVWARGTWWPA